MEQPLVNPKVDLVYEGSHIESESKSESDFLEASSHDENEGSEGSDDESEEYVIEESQENDAGLTTNDCHNSLHKGEFD